MIKNHRAEGQKSYHLRPPCLQRKCYTVVWTKSTIKKVIVVCEETLLFGDSYFICEMNSNEGTFCYLKGTKQSTLHQIIWCLNVFLLIPFNMNVRFWQGSKHKKNVFYIFHHIFLFLASKTCSSHNELICLSLLCYVLPQLMLFCINILSSFPSCWDIIYLSS